MLRGTTSVPSGLTTGTLIGYKRLYPYAVTGVPVASYTHMNNVSERGSQDVFIDSVRSVSHLSTALLTLPKQLLVLDHYLYTQLYGKRLVLSSIFFEPCRTSALPFSAVPARRQHTAPTSIADRRAPIRFRLPAPGVGWYNGGEI